MIDKIGIVGAGQMGGGIAHVCALAGLDVTLLDIEDAVLRGRRTPSAAISPPGLARQNRRGRRRRRCRAHRHDHRLRGFAACDAVVEAATENEEIKRAVFQSMLPHCAMTP